jgi:plasmid stabilization system protein ParE
MNTKQHFLLPRCTGMNCGATDANHSPECRAEHAAAIAGGRFVKDEKRAADDAEREFSELIDCYQSAESLRERVEVRREMMAAFRSALSARADSGKDSIAKTEEVYRHILKQNGQAAKRTTPENICDVFEAIAAIAGEKK